MRRHLTAIVIVAATLCAVIIVVASGARQVADGTSTGDAVVAAPTGPRRPQPQGLFGTVDVAAARRSMATLERARTANPHNVRFVLDLADAYAAAQRHGDALAAYKDALALSPGHPNASVGLARVWYAKGDDERAVRLLERVVQAFPGHQQARYELARVLFSRGRIAAAREMWVKAAEIDPASALGRSAQDFVDLLSDTAAP
ncbi:MAG TPA: tetratricopeptide repeat protein [Thermoleophilia bacterium]|nr:tetratricopeptide repeat protein [Thermoleophilia bacterium]